MEILEKSKELMEKLMEKLNDFSGKQVGWDDYREHTADMRKKSELAREPKEKEYAAQRSSSLDQVESVFFLPVLPVPMVNL